MLTEEQVSFFHENGYLIAGKLLEEDEVVRMRDELDAVLGGKTDTGQMAEYAETIENVDPAQGGVLQIVNVWKQNSLFRRHHSHEALVTMARQLTGADSLRLFHDQILSKPAAGRPVAWHQDYGYWQMVTPAELLTCWVALDPATVANGCMEVIPGSHRWGLLEAQTDLSSDDPEAMLKAITPPDGASMEKVCCELPAGHCMWHHCLTLHGSGPNSTDQPRRAVITHVMPGTSRFDKKHAHLMAQYAESDKLKDGAVLAGAHFPEL